MDSLTGIVFEDDSQIKLASVEIMKPDKDPRIEIFIEEIVEQTIKKVSKIENRKSEISLALYRWQTKNI